jgi:uncharacterized cupredoxin-like copper-binding protein
MTRLAVAGALTLALAIAGCAEIEATEIEARLTEASITLQSTRAEPGVIRFRIDNVGTEVHEFEIFAGATPGMVLPVSSNVADTTGLRVVDEIENLFPGGQGTLTVDLRPGTYLVICNLPGHYELGMSTTITVAAGGGG